MINKKRKLFDLISKYSWSFFRKDFLAAVTVFVMLVPQAMAYAMLAGLPPVMGLYASTIPLLMYAIFSSSKHLSVGPVAITSLLVFTGVSLYEEPGSPSYIALVLALTFMVGVIQLLLGVIKAGHIVKFIPQAVISGYTTAAALMIALSQIKNLVGINIGNHLQLHLLLLDLLRLLHEIHFPTFVIGAVSIVLLLLLRRLNSRIPAALLIVILSIVSIAYLSLEETGVRIVGNVPTGIPHFSFPSLSIDYVTMLWPMAITIALLGFMESLAISKLIARKEKYRIDANQELKALGIANISGGVFQAYTVNGSFSRSAVSHESGSVSQLTSILTVIFIGITLLFFTSSFYYLPHSVLAALIIVSVSKMVDFKEAKRLFSIKPFEGWVWVATFLVTLGIGIQWGIIFGAIFTLVLILKRSAQPTVVEIGYIEKKSAFRDIKRYPEAKTFAETVMIRIDSNLHVANIVFVEEKIKALLKDRTKVKWIILDMSGVNDMDTVSIEILKDMVDFYNQKYGIVLLFANMKGTIRDIVEKAGWKKQYKEQLRYLSVEEIVHEKGLNKQLPEEVDFYI